MAIKKRTTQKQKAASRRNLEKARAAKNKGHSGWSMKSLNKLAMHQNHGAMHGLSGSSLRKAVKSAGSIPGYMVKGKRMENWLKKNKIKIYRGG